MDKRTEIQTLATQHIIDNKFRGILQVAPRVGKCKIVIDALNTVSMASRNISILIIAPKKEIFKGWKTDIKKWDLKEKNFDIEYVWSNSLKKVDEKYDLIIADEIHEYNLKVLEELAKHKAKGSRILGLTGTLDNDSKYCIHEIVGITPIYVYTVDEAIEDKIVADYRIYCVECELDTENKYVDAGSEEKPFKQTEYDAYGYWDRKYNTAVSQMRYKQMRFPMMRRKSIIYESKTKVNITKKIIEKFDRCLIFTGYQKIADSLGDAAFHSKSDKDTLEKLKSGAINKVSVVSMVSMGVTIPNLKVTVFNQLKSGENTAVQQAMRAMNLDGDKIATIVIVYLKGTRDQVWMESALKGFNSNKITFCKYEDLP
jgi:superfamily II DNA or RNA helicase